ncbi:hypothetical protein BIY24_15710 [Halobacteriovorax marinus]|uniref:Exported protein n=1 Tax=Halobacteriovorax marinus (strain ATCC BAA-682 / DSM 15412 / SJ) TaxID=862908 RepID=E1X0Z9_HALMS|nr:hypothetical protein [Halobacteriovorax marinus]ATH09333.1 hypothetical protein BIY24_15710 [Halobacteriovorax marinus]CBW28069.1 putative exported protein [Halobacteriovorax marinus SJ]
MKLIKLLPLLVLAVVAYSNTSLQPIAAANAAGDGGVKDADCNCGPADDGDPNVGYRTINQDLILTVNDDLFNNDNDIEDLLRGGEEPPKNPLLDDRFQIDENLIRSVNNSDLIDSLNIIKK